MSELFKLFATFARIGGFTFGGGYAMLPLLQREIVNKYNWATEEELMDYYAIGQCTPGIIAVNVATFIGYKRRGVLGAIFSTLGVVAPSIVIITIIAALISNFADLEAVKNAFSGIRVCVCVLIFNSVMNLGKKSIVNKYAGAVFVIVFLLAAFTGVSTIALVIASGAAGYIINRLQRSTK